MEVNNINDDLDMNTIFYMTGLKAFSSKTNSLTENQIGEALDEIKEVMTNEILKAVDRAYEYTKNALREGGDRNTFLMHFGGYLDLIGDIFGNDINMSDVYSKARSKYLDLLY